MKAVILSPGPSLANLSAIPPCDLSIAVNRAATKFAVTLWAANDYPVLRDNKVLGTPSVLTRRQTWEDIGKRLSLPLAATIEEITGDCPTSMLVRTMPGAMLYAFRHGAKRIELYGCDWKGTADFDGAEAGEDRTEKRWEAERADVSALMDWLSNRGAEVVRHGNDG